MTQPDAAMRMGITRANVSSAVRGDFANLPERKLVDCLIQLGYNLEIKAWSTKIAVEYPTESPIDPFNLFFSVAAA